MTEPVGDWLNPVFQWIDTASGLRDLLASIAVDSPVALDTEFFFEKTYAPQPGLIQLATDYDCALVDTCAIDDWGALAAFLDNPDRLILVHAGDQDLMILRQLTGTQPGLLVDTQRAAAILGQRPVQVGLAKLVEQELQLVLPKGEQRSDWLKRPLSQQQQQYAAVDTCILLPLWHRLRDRLQQCNRLEWLYEDGQLLLQQRPQMPDYRSIRGWKRLSPEALGFLQALVQWRERTAVTKDRPRRWICADEVLLRLAESPPGTADDFAGRRVPRQSVRDLLALARISHPSPPLPPKVPNGKSKLEAMRELVARQAAALDVDPTLLASTPVLSDYMSNGFTLPAALATGWRYQYCGRHLQALVQGWSLSS